jgi:CPA2 family monovalent cation:H+ antiporter-2
VVIDHSERAVQELRNAKIPYLYGNAASSHVLETAGVDRAAAMAIALSDPMNTRLCLKRSLGYSPALDITVIAYRDQDIELLYHLGAKEVVQPEFEASLELSTHLLVSMGLPLKDIQQQTQKIRNSHYLDLRPEESPEKISRNLQEAAQNMNSKWYSLPEDSPLEGMTIQQTDLRHLSGVSVMAIRRSNGEEVDYPDSNTPLNKGDRLLLVGEPEALAILDQLAKGEVQLPSESVSCQWLIIVENSPAVGKTLADIDLLSRYSVQVQALRRQGKFLRWPHPSIDLQAGDHLLLCGGFQNLNQVRCDLIPITPPANSQNVTTQTKIESEPLEVKQPATL